MGGRQRVRALVAAGLAFGLLTTEVRAAPESDLLAVAAAARKSLVRVSWVDNRRPDNAFERVGVAVRSDGLILVAGPTMTAQGAYAARLLGGAVVPAQFVASDRETALTLIRVSGKTLVPHPGLDPQMPAGSVPATAPFVMVHPDGAVARGVLRARERYDRFRIRNRSVRTTALQEAALTSLSSDRGAPWLAADGALIGLHYGRTLGTEPSAREQARALGLRLRPEVVASYAVPARVARIVWPLLAAHGRVPRAALDTSTVAMDEAMRAQLCPGCGGHVVVALRADGAGARAGLRRHDVILAVADVNVPVAGTLHDVLLPHRPGQRVSLQILRGGERLTLAVTLGQRTQLVGVEGR